jgi:hypothetical protein
MSGSALATDAGAAAMRREMGRDLAARRRAGRLVQRELAGKTGYHRSVIGHAEQGRGDAGPAFWAKIDEVLGTGALFTDRDQRIRDLARPAAADGVRRDGELGVSDELTGTSQEDALAAYRRGGWPVRERPGGLALITGDAVDACDVAARAGRLAARWWQETGGRPDVVRGLPGLPPPGSHLAVIDAGERWLFLVQGGACPWRRDDLVPPVGRDSPGPNSARPNSARPNSARHDRATVGWHVPGSPVSVPPSDDGRITWAVLPPGTLALAPPLAVLHLLARAAVVTRDPAVLRLGCGGPSGAEVRVIPVSSGPAFAGEGN